MSFVLNSIAGVSDEPVKKRQDNRCMSLFGSLSELANVWLSRKDKGTSCSHLQSHTAKQKETTNRGTVSEKTGTIQHTDQAT